MRRDPEKHPWSEPAKRKLNPSIKVHQFPCLQDNYGYLVHCKASQLTACIDTPSVAATQQALADTGWTLTHILNTHHHEDHAGGNLELKEKTGCIIVGPAHDAEAAVLRRVLAEGGPLAVARADHADVVAEIELLGPRF